MGALYGRGRHASLRAMADRRKRLEEQLAEAERELDAATKPSEIRAAAAKRRLALEGLQWLKEREAKRGI
jgi:hypothetical protein